MLTEIKLGLETTKATLSLLKTVRDVTDKANLDAVLFDIRNHLAELQEKLLDTQQATEAILEENRNLKTELKAERDNNSLLENYRLIEPRIGVFLYEYEPIEGDKTLRHQACPNCFSDKQISLLQRLNANDEVINCSKCDFSYHLRTKEEWNEIARKNQEYHDNLPEHDAFSL